jgi:hypothetical protein
LFFCIGSVSAAKFPAETPDFTADTENFPALLFSFRFLELPGQEQQSG